MDSFRLKFTTKACKWPGTQFCMNFFMIHKFLYSRKKYLVSIFLFFKNVRIVQSAEAFYDCGLHKLVNPQKYNQIVTQRKSSFIVLYIYKGSSY